MGSVRDGLSVSRSVEEIEMSDIAEKLISCAAGSVSEASINLMPGSDIDNIVYNLNALITQATQQLNAAKRYARDLDDRSLDKLLQNLHSDLDSASYKIDSVRGHLDKHYE